jgi:modulator of FtsH protease
VPALILAAFGLPIMARAISLMLGAGGGLYWFVPLVTLGFVGAVWNACVLLVEILR